MKKAWRTVSNVLGIAAGILLAGSFPVKHFWGQTACDWTRAIGFALLLVYCGVLPLLRRRRNRRS